MCAWHALMKGINSIWAKERKNILQKILGSLKHLPTIFYYNIHSEESRFNFICLYLKGHIKQAPHSHTKRVFGISKLVMFKELFKYPIRFLMTNLITENFHLCNLEIFLPIIHKNATKNNKNFF